MFFKKLIPLGLLYLVSAVIANTNRVEIEDDLRKFLGELERYEMTRNDVVFLLDESGSIGADRFPEVKQFTKLIAQRLSVSSEYSRVAVVTFATETITHINYIKDPIDNNMCTLLRKIDDIGYAAEWTHTDKAMRAAEQILAHARSDSKKIIVLLTDGQSNAGHSPVAIAKELKQKGIVIFAVGVASVNEEEIDAVATNKNHIYILRNFDYIVQVNKFLVNDSRDVVMDLAKDSSQCSALCTEGGNCCDEHANCYCGTKSGRYECACIAGYHGRGGKGECHKCPRGTYKSTARNTECTVCPEHATTLKAGSTKFEDCECDTGYEKNGNFCTPVKCASLSAPDGGILIPSHCSNTFGSKCSFKCRAGYCPFSCNSNNLLHQTATAHSLLPARTCLENREWSGVEFHCERITCPILSPPNNGLHNCSENDFTYGSICHFTCEKGFKLSGSKFRTCLINSSWTGTHTDCKRIYCSKVKTNQYLRVKPPECGAQDMPYESVCQYHCAKGYSMDSEDNNTGGVLKCGADKKWSGINTKIGCKDRTPPEIKCPKSVEVVAIPQQGSAEVSWELPTATDNIAVKNIRIIEPKTIKKPPYKFPIGSTKITYKAVDEVKLSKTCSFTIKVLDKEPPQVISCPSDIEVFYERNTPISVEWKDPVFEDNSKKKLTIKSNRRSGETFAWGLEHRIQYNATDESGNTAFCSFLVKVKSYACPYYAPPANGVLTCDNWEDGKICSIFCHEGFEFAASQSTNHTYYCQISKRGGKIEAVWVPIIPNMKSLKLPWPDCSRKQAPSAFDVTVGISYAVDSCSEEILQKMRENFISVLAPLPPNTFCVKSRGCTPENVKITCSPVSGRKKRSVHSTMIHKRRHFHGNSKKRLNRDAPRQVLTITFNIEMQPPNVTDLNPEVTSHSITGSVNSEYNINLISNPVIKELENKISENVKDVYKMTNVPEPETHFDVIVMCSVGQIKVKNTCVNCPAGTYKDDVSETCIDCPIATYQDDERQLSCKACPVDHTTYQVKSKSIDDCKAPCRPGTYSKTTFEPCLACPENTYQEKSARKDCSKCPTGLYSWKVGSYSSSDCVAPCKPGSFSDSGFEPCTLCDENSYQDQAQQRSCNFCPNHTHTSVKGSRNADDCKEFDICDEQRPCHSGSTCIQLDKDYQCLCPEGLVGSHCEINLDDCAFSPCLNNGTCIDGIGNFSCVCLEGWTGHQCETNIDDCDPDPCKNGGECIDMLNSYECKCLPGFTGEHCEINVYECESNPCLNNGICFDKQNGYRCCCAVGYYGENCEKELNYCDTVTCENGGTCFSTHDGFNCTCQPGFEGEFCEVNIDDCENFLCENNGVCVDEIKNATCSCLPQFFGTHCEKAFMPEFLLHFPIPSTSNYVELKNDHLLYAITVAFYMRTNFQDLNSRATPVSYSYKSKYGLVDNALTLLDTNNFVLYIHGKTFHTSYSANRDSLWHHYAVTWEKMDGKWSFYVDGNSVAEGSHVGETTYMYPGIFILGQEQDSLGDSFSSVESFQGDITEFNVWDYALSATELKKILSSCGFVGNVIPWYKAALSVHGSVNVLQDVDKCSALGTCSSTDCGCFYSNKTKDICKYDVTKCDASSCANDQVCVTDEYHSYCNCSSTFEGRHCEYDVDECLKSNGGCEYYCKNDHGSHHCECPEDMFLFEDGKSCKETGFCTMNGEVYPDGETWISSCQQCSCNLGIVSCEEIVCNQTACQPAETLIMAPGECCPKCVAWSFCLISPNNTIMTFDMSDYKIEGNCVYTAVEDCISGRFKVQIQTFANMTDKSNLVIYQDCSKILISSDGSIIADDKTVELPFKNEDVSIEVGNSSIIVRTQSDMFVQWNFTDEVVIAVPITDVNTVCGLCSRMEEYLTSNFGRYPFPERIASGETECFAVKEVYKESHSGTKSNIVLSCYAAITLQILFIFFYADVLLLTM